MTPLGPMLLTAWIAAATVMLILWMIHLAIHNAGVLDMGWAANLSLIAVLYSLMGNGYGPRKFLVAAMALLWGSRLSFLILMRVLRQREDERYQDMRKRWGGNTALKFFFLFQFQALLDVFLSIVFLFPAVNPKAGLSLLEWTGFILWCLAATGETLADHQLKKFKSDPSSKGKTCRLGLWKYSRHPNYFFEWLNWCAYFLIAIASPHGYLAMACPILMLYFLFQVSGIPLTEAQALKSRGEDYREYQRTTSVFIPWFPKKSSYGTA